MKKRTLISRKKVKKPSRLEVKKTESYSLNSKSVAEHISLNEQPPPTQSNILIPTIYDFSTKVANKNNSYIIEDEEESYKLPQYKNFELEIRND